MSELERAIAKVLADRYSTRIRLRPTPNCKHHPHPVAPRFDFAIAA